MPGNPDGPPVAGGARRLVCEVKAVGEPRYLAQAITSLTLAARKAPRIYPVVVAPYISPEGRRLCREAGVGYLDLTGNAFLRFDGILVDRLSAEPPPRAKARLRRLFAPKSSRALRVLLEQPGAGWTLARLAAKLTAHAVSHKEAVGFTLHSGAAFVAPFVRSPDVHAYFVGDRERLVKALDLRPVESGGMVHLLDPYNEGVFYRVQTIRGVRVLCNTQLYLDLINYPARGREQAEVLRREKLGY